MGRWQVSVSSEMFHRQPKKRSSLGVPPETITRAAETIEDERLSPLNDNHRLEQQQQSGCTAKMLHHRRRRHHQQQQGGRSTEMLHYCQTNQPPADGGSAQNVVEEEEEEEDYQSLNEKLQDNQRGGTAGSFDAEERAPSGNQNQRGEKRSGSSSVSRIISIAAGIEARMCSGNSVEVATDRAAAPAQEEWSPIREGPPPPPHYQAFDRFPAEEPGATSDMDTEDDFVPLMRMPREAATAPAAAAAAEDVRAGLAFNDLGLSNAVARNVDALDRIGGGDCVTVTAGEPAPKRKRLPDLGSNPVVQVSYEGLTRESKNVLQQALQSWAYWHSRSYASGASATEEVLQSGTEAYSPALTLGPTSSTGVVSVWMDMPLKNGKAKIQDSHDSGTLESQDKEKDIPLYDRVCVSALSSQDLANPDGHISLEPEGALRCFNCGSYSHSLRTCPRPHAMAAIRHARSTLRDKKGRRPRMNSRYYQRSPGGKFDDLNPGTLSLEARKAIGIGELDPPPWLNRMREIGYPPGYLDSEDTESSGVEIFDDDPETGAGNESIKELVSENVTPVEECNTYPDGVAGNELIKEGNVSENLTHVEDRNTAQKMVVAYPGINAPIPENADKNLWAVSSGTETVELHRGFKRPYHQISQMHNSGSGPLLPKSPARSKAIGMGDGYLRESVVRSSVSSGQPESYSRNRSDVMDAYIDARSSNLYGTTSHVVNMNGKLSVDPVHHWSKRRVNGTSSLSVERTYSYNTRPDHHIRSSPSGLASPIRGMFSTPSPVQHTSSASRIYSHHYNHQSGPQASHISSGESPVYGANQAWLKAQSALYALHTTGGLLEAPHRATWGALQHSRTPGMPHNGGGGN